MNAKTKQSSTSKKDKLVLFSLLILAAVLVVIFSNIKSVQTIEVINGPTAPPNMQGPDGPPPSS